MDKIGTRSKFTLPNLPYDYADLEPIISRDIMHLHHEKHHAAYVNNYNIAEEKLQQALEKSISNISYSNIMLTPNTKRLFCRFVISDDTNAILALGPALKFNGGGHINHSIFWEVLTPSTNAGKPSSK